MQTGLLEMRRVVLALVPLLSELLGCSTIAVTETDDFQVRTEPTGAVVTREGPGNDMELGPAPVTVSADYVIERWQFNRWAWLAPVLSAGLIGAGYGVFWGGETELGNAVGCTGIAGTGLGLVICIAAEIMNGRPNVVPTTVMLGARLDGYDYARQLVQVPVASGRVDLTMSKLRPSEPVVPKPPNAPAPKIAPAPPAVPARLGSVIAVFEVQDLTGSLTRSTVNQLTEYLSTRITEVTGYRVVPRSQLREEMQLTKAQGYSECFDLSCQIELGKAVAAEKSLSVQVLRVGSQCALSASLFDLRTETTSQAASTRTGCSPDVLMDAVDVVATKLKASSNR